MMIRPSLKEIQCDYSVCVILIPVTHIYVQIVHQLAKELVPDSNLLFRVTMHSINLNQRP